MKVCYSAISATQSIVPYAYESGIFKKYGLDVSLQFINSGSNSVLAILAGDVAACQVAGTAVVNAQAAGQDVVIIAGIFNNFPATIFVRPEIKTAADLKGKALGITDFGGSIESITRIALKKWVSNQIKM
jgi:NitT/TauT family transport system substrate-binding protein